MSRIEWAARSGPDGPDPATLTAFGMVAWVIKNRHASRHLWILEQGGDVLASGMDEYASDAFVAASGALVAAARSHGTLGGNDIVRVVMRGPKDAGWGAMPGHRHFPCAEPAGDPEPAYVERNRVATLRNASAQLRSLAGRVPGPEVVGALVHTNAVALVLADLRHREGIKHAIRACENAVDAVGVAVGASVDAAIRRVGLGARFTPVDASLRILADACDALADKLEAADA